MYANNFNDELAKETAIRSIKDAKNHFIQGKVGSGKTQLMFDIVKTVVVQRKQWTNHIGKLNKELEEHRVKMPDCGICVVKGFKVNPPMDNAEYKAWYDTFGEIEKKIKRSEKYKARSCTKFIRWQDFIFQYAFAEFNRKNELVKNLVNFDGVLMLDDLGVQSQIKEYEMVILLNIIDYRAMYERPTIISTNLTIAEISKLYGERVGDRLNSYLKINKNKNNYRK